MNYPSLAEVGSEREVDEILRRDHGERIACNERSVFRNRLDNMPIPISVTSSAIRQTLASLKRVPKPP
jgi:hypothetical protein